MMGTNRRVWFFQFAAIFDFGLSWGGAGASGLFLFSNVRERAQGLEPGVWKNEKFAFLILSKAVGVIGPDGE